MGLIADSDGFKSCAELPSRLETELALKIMKFRSHTTVSMIRLNMTPMISIALLFIICLMSTLEVTEFEGDFDRNLPLVVAGATAGPDADRLPFKVRLVASDGGELSALQLNDENLGNGEQAFARLNTEVFLAVSTQYAIGPEQRDDLEVEIEPDYNLHYRHIINAIGACSGRLGPNGVPVRFISKIRFAPPREQ